jgi:membrane protein DedA with SNARE-associated domain
LSIVHLQAIEGLFQSYGYAVIILGIMLESMGMPLPGESLMIAAALYAATTHQLNIFLLVPLAAAGAIAGDQVGYFIGRFIGYRLLAHWGQKLGLSNDRLELGRYLFRRYGGTVVFLGRFVAILRTFVALLAGANRMPWHTFLIWNALGGIGWTSLYGFGAYLLGDAAQRLSGPIGIALGIAAGAALIAAVVFVNRNEAGLLEDARQEMRNP